MTAPRSDHTIQTNRYVGAQKVSRRRSGNRTGSSAGREEFTAWLTASCQRQDLPVTITDPRLLATIATLLR
jgi:hypothetical protein